MNAKTPFRYPGGKSKLYKEVKKIIECNQLSNKIYVEPYSGGYGVGIKLMLNNDINQFIINDYDYHVYAFWISVFEHNNELIKKVQRTNINIDEWQAQKNIFENYKLHSILDVGFSTLFLNRTNYSGILKSGPIGGFDQSGKYKIDCRFNKNNIINLIQKISTYKKQVRIYNYDAKKLIKELKDNEENILYNFDPPYVVKGRELYINFYNKKDHVELKKFIQDINSKWIMTYDNTDFIKELYSNFYINEFDLTYSVTTIKKGKEVLISNFEINDFNKK